MKIAIIVLSWQNELDTDACIRSILESDAVAFGSEIVLVDNCSQDGSYERLLSSLRALPHLTFLRTDRDLGYAGGNNVGIRYCLEKGFDYIVIISSDCLAPNQFIGPAVSAFSVDDSIGIVTGKILYHTDRRQIWYAGGRVSRLLAVGIHRGLRQTDRGQFDRPGYVTFVSGAFMVVKPCVLKQVGFLDESFFMYFEDVEFSLRVMQGGFSMYYTPSVEVVHKVGAGHTLASYSPVYLYYSTRNRMLCFRNSPLGYRAYVKALSAALAMAKIAVLSLSGTREQVSAVARGCWDGIRFWG